VILAPNINIATVTYLQYSGCAKIVLLTMVTVGLATLIDQSANHTTPTCQSHCVALETTLSSAGGGVELAQLMPHCSLIAEWKTVQWCATGLCENEIQTMHMIEALDVWVILWAQFLAS